MKKIYKITFETEENDRKVVDFLIANADIIEIKNPKQTRTSRQNRALHKWFTMLSDELNEKHIDMRTLIRPEIKIEFTLYSVKEYLWKPLQLAFYGTNSTKKLLKTKQIDKIYDTLNQVITERTGGNVDFPPFPRRENL